MRGRAAGRFPGLAGLLLSPPRGHRLRLPPGVVAFLAGPDSDYMTEQAINVDGGGVMGN